jgi:thioredoxin-like negative regulator of GroEL
MRRGIFVSGLMFLVAGSCLAAPAPPPVKVITTTDRRFQADVVDASNNKLMMVVFTAPWCLPCGGVVGQLTAAAERRGFGIATMDADANSVIPDRFKVSSLPVTIAYRDKMPIGSHIGPFDRDSMDSFFVQVGALDVRQGQQP